MPNVSMLAIFSSCVMTWPTVISGCGSIASF